LGKFLGSLKTELFNLRGFAMVALVVSVIFFKDSSLWVKKVCVGEVSMDDDGCFDGSLVDINNPNNLMRITGGEFCPKSIYAVSFSLDFAGREYKVILEERPEKVSAGLASLGLMGKYGPADKHGKELHPVAASFCRKDRLS
jgi:hypothetical protein